MMTETAPDLVSSLWQKRSSSRRFAFSLFLVALLQSAALAWMIYDRVSLLERGKEIILDIVPVDPRSLFRGDYVILSYGISRLQLSALGGDDKFETDMTVFVTLRKPYRAAWQPVSVTKKYPAEVDEDQIVIRGKVRYGGREPLRVNYGIEQYFVQEGRGKPLERQVRESKLQALVAIGADGEAAVKGLLVDGKLQYKETLF